MAELRHLLALRICAVMAVFLVPVVASAGSDIDVKDLRARLKVAVAGQNMAQAADVMALRRTLGLASVEVQDAPPIEQPIITALAPIEAPISGEGTHGLFALQTAPPIEQPIITALAPIEAPISGEGTHGLFALQTAQPQIATQPAAPLGGAGGLFAKTTIQQPAASQGLAPLDVSITNFRLMLATLAQTYSGVNSLSVVTAQGTRGPIALSVRSGTVTLADIKFFSTAEGHAPRADGSLTLPVVVWPEATLRLTRGERLALARDTGAFLISMGRLEVKDAVIEVSGPENPFEHNFAPFITIASGGSIHLEGTTVRGLGFGRTIKFAGLTVAGNPLMPTRQNVVIRNNMFEQVQAVTVAGAPRAQVSGNTFQDAGGNALNIVGSPHAQVRRNLFRGTARTNAIRVNVGSDNAIVADNVFLKGQRVAILINGGSNNVVVRGNLIWRRDGAGIKFFNSRCGLAQGNVLIDNRQKGIEVRKSNGIVVRDNLLAGNGSAGVWVSAQAKLAQTTVSDNVFDGNAAGLAAATGAEIWIKGNNFQRQLPKLLDGDIANLSDALVRDLTGDHAMRLAQGQSEQRDSLATLCGGEL